MPLAGIARAWVELSAAMPLGWYLEGVIRTPAAVWQAIAASPQGEQVSESGANLYIQR
jgi:hypothetical protein